MRIGFLAFDLPMVREDLVGNDEAGHFLVAVHYGDE